MGTDLKSSDSLLDSDFIPVQTQLFKQNLYSSKFTTNQQLRQRAKQAIAAGDYPKAIALLSQVIARLPHSALDYNNRGLIYFYGGQIKKAIRDYNQAIALDDTLDSPYNNRANGYAALGDYPQALADYESAIDLNPLNMRTWLNWGITLREAQDYNLALEKFDEALIIGRQLQGRLYAERGYTYYLRGDWNCAIADYRRAIERLAQADPYRQKVVRLLQQLLSFATGSSSSGTPANP